MSAEKTTRQVSFQFNGQSCQGYEIHQGVSDTEEAIMQTNHCIGTYIHGFLDNQSVIDYLLGTKQSTMAMDADTFKDEQYNKLAAHVRQYVDIPRIYEILSHD